MLKQSEKILLFVNSVFKDQYAQNNFLVINVYINLRLLFLFLSISNSNSEIFSLKRKFETNVKQLIFLYRFEQILLDQEPLPSCGLKLLLTLLDQNGGFIKQFEQMGLVSVIFQVMMVGTNHKLICQYLKMQFLGPRNIYLSIYRSFICDLVLDKPLYVCIHLFVQMLFHTSLEVSLQLLN